MEIMMKVPGVGLAANQIGVLKKIVTINIQDKEKNLDNKYVYLIHRLFLFPKKW